MQMKSIQNGKLNTLGRGSQFYKVALKPFAGLAVILLCWGVFAADVTIPSTWDEASQTYIGDVIALTNAMANLAANQTVYLSRGVYDLSFLADAEAPLYTGGYGHSLLAVSKENAQLVGLTGDPNDVILKAVDANYRIILLSGKNAKIRDLTITGGNAASTYISTYNYRVGGAIGLASSEGVVSNCVFYGNKAGTRGGAVSGLNALYGHVYDCVFYSNNDTPSGALAANHSRFYNCTFTNNVYVGANNNYSTSVVGSSHLYNCRLADNQASYCAGVHGGSATDCTFINNKIANGSYGLNWSNPGGAAARDAALTNCYFYGNTGHVYGGAIRGGEVVNCTVVSNCAQNANSGAGAGVYKATLVANSMIASNVCVNGGGIHGDGTTIVTNCVIAYNFAKSAGGAACNCQVIMDSTIKHNASFDYHDREFCGSGGVEGGRIYRCTFRDNCASSVNGAKYMEDCDVSDGRIDCLTNINCVIHNLHNQGDYTWCKGNVYFPEGHTISNMYAITSVHVMRNCLITNNAWRSGPDSYVNTALFNACSGTVENCTIADNVHYHFTRRQRIENDIAYPLVFINCAIVGNRRFVEGPINDTTTMDSSLVCFSNCIWNVMGSRAAQAEGYVDSNCTTLGADVSPLFVGTGEHPYTPAWFSPLRVTDGLVLDWMATATDLIGNPRLRDGKVGIGCYQCWLNPTRFLLKIR